MMPGVASSKFELDPAFSTRVPIVIVPALLPAARLPPARTVTLPAMLPTPPRVAPLWTVTAVFPSEPFTRKVPFPPTLVAPV